MPHIVQQQDLDILFQKSKELFVKIQLLNKDYTVVDELSGEALSGSISLNTDSASRRSLNLSMHIKNISLFIGRENRIWLDKLLRIYIGVLHLRTNQVMYYPIGIYIMNETSYLYDNISNTLTLGCMDLMALLDGTRDGVIGTAEVLIPAGNDIRTAVISTITQLSEIKQYKVVDIHQEVPYDLTFNIGATVYEVLAKLRDLYPAWEMYFDVDGTFIYQPIPTCLEDNIVVDNAILQQILISDSVNVTMGNVKNATEVFGRSNTCDRYTDTSSNTGAQYNLTFDLFELKERMTIGFKTNTASAVGASIKINSIDAIPICDEYGTPILGGRLKANTSYVFRYKNDKFYLLGEFQIYAIAYDDNPESPFFVGENKKNVVLQVLKDGDYKNIWSDDLAQERADYENWLACRFNDSIAIKSLLIPWLECNQKIEFQPHSSKEVNQYIVKSINFDILSGIMDITALRFYPLYPSIVKNKK